MSLGMVWPGEALRDGRDGNRKLDRGRQKPAKVGTFQFEMTGQPIFGISGEVWPARVDDAARVGGHVTFQIGAKAIDDAMRT